MPTGDLRIHVTRRMVVEGPTGPSTHGPWGASLTSLISRTRSLFNRVGLDGKAMLQSTGGSCTIVLPPGAWVDLEVARRRLDRASGAMRRGDRRRSAPGRHGGVEYPAPAVPHRLGSEWIEQVRRSMRAGLDPLRDAGYQRLMAAELARSDSSAALKAFDRCERLMPGVRLLAVAGHHGHTPADSHPGLIGRRAGASADARYPSRAPACPGRVRGRVLSG